VRISALLVSITIDAAGPIQQSWQAGHHEQRTENTDQIHDSESR
jgi:hypothetical protein